MNKHDLAAARKAMLEAWIEILNESAIRRERAIVRQTEERKRIKDDEHEDDEGGFIENPGLLLAPPYELRVSSDMMNLLVDGIGAALAGKADPFSINPPRGNRPTLTKQERIMAVVQVLDEVLRGKCADKAIEDVAESLDIPKETIRDYYYNKEIKTWADLYRRSYKRRPRKAD